MPGRLLLAGISTRAAADSAARAGFEVIAIDGFADLDQHPAVRAIPLPNGFDVSTAVAAAASVECEAVAYLSGFENHPDAVEQLSRGRRLWGNAPSVLRQVRSPQRLADALRARGFCTPALGGHGKGPWLEKPLASGGGHGVRSWEHGRPQEGTHYLQERIDGIPGSITFVAARGQVSILGLSQQLAGEAAFGASGFRYCGSILTGMEDLALDDNATLLETARNLAAAVSEDFDLVGVNGLDFVAARGVPYPIEVNPRWSASMELVERAYGVSVFGAHAHACVERALIDFDLAAAQRHTETHGKAILFARHDVTVGDTMHWLEDMSVRDVPHPGQVIDAGSPICTVFATGRNAEDCRKALQARAERAYADLGASETSS